MSLASSAQESAEQSGSQSSNDKLVNPLISVIYASYGISCCMHISVVQCIFVISVM